jgi:hypothetical protein
MAMPHIHLSLLVTLCTALLALNGAHAVDIEAIKSSAQALQPWLKQIRRELHQFPELMFQEINTSARIRQHLDELDISYKYPYAKTGVVGRIGNGKPVIALRADIDALPVHEPEGLAFISKNQGRMHACGHDGEWSNCTITAAFQSKCASCLNWSGYMAMHVTFNPVVLAPSVGLHLLLNPNEHKQQRN